MSLCCSHYRDWLLQLEVISEEGKIERYPYHIEVKSDENSTCCCGCCQNGVHGLTVNGKEVGKQIYDNICFPLCGSGGEYEWQEKGHFFRLELPSLFIHDGLYVDGKELKSRRLNTSEWKYQFAVWLVLGVLIISIGVAFIAMEISGCCWKGFLYLGISCLVTGFLTFLPGLIGCFKATSLNRQYKKLQQLKKREKNHQTTKF